MYNLAELNKEGITAERFYSDDWNLAIDERLMSTVTSFGFEISPLEYDGIINRLRTIKNFPLRWSDWHVIPYLQTGEFSSFTCASFASYILYGEIIELPDELVEACRLDYQNEKFNSHAHALRN